MFGSSKKTKKPSLIKRLIYLFAFLTTGGGFGGWALKDHPQVRTLISLVTGADEETLDAIDAKAVQGKVAEVVGEVITKSRSDFSKPGVYQVTISKVKLDPSAFKPGQRIDIQAKVLKLDPRGRDAIVWESKPFGPRVAEVGKDELSASWPMRSFQVSWNPGDSLVVEVYDHRGGLFVQPRRYALAPPDPNSQDFPLKSGTFALVPIKSNDVASKGNQIDFVSSRIGDIGQKNSTQVAERPIVIK